MSNKIVTVLVGNTISEALSNNGEIKNFYSFGGFINESTISIVLTCIFINHSNVFSENYYFSVELYNEYKLPKGDVLFKIIDKNHKMNQITIQI